MKIYLATAYSHPSAGIRFWRFEMVNRAAGELMKQGNIVFSPISHSHPIALHIGNSLSHDFWLTQDKAYMDWADKMIVVSFRYDVDPCPTYDSYGINYEVDYMRDHGKPVEWWCYDD